MAITINTDATQEQRIAVALGGVYTLLDAQGNRRNATNQEIQRWIKQQLKNVVENYEEAQARKALVITPFDAS